MAEEYDHPRQVYRRLIEVVTNETTAPEVLPYETTIIDLIVDQVKHMNANLDKLKPKLNRFCIEQHQMELERFSFVLRKYHRTRLEKIEKTAINLVKQLNTPEGHNVVMSLLSPAELKYLDRYVTSIDNHLKKVAVDKFPTIMQDFKLIDITSDEKTQFDCNYVFVKANERSSVTVDDPVTGQEVVSMEKGSQHFLPYSAVRDHLIAGSKDLLLL